MSTLSPWLLMLGLHGLSSTQHFQHFPVINSNSNFVGRNTEYLATVGQFDHPQYSLGFGREEKHFQRKRVKSRKRKVVSKYKTEQKIKPMVLKNVDVYKETSFTEPKDETHTESRLEVTEQIYKPKAVDGNSKTARWGQKAKATWGRKILKLKRISLRSKNRKKQKLKLKTNRNKMKLGGKFDSITKNKNRKHDMLKNHIKRIYKPKKLTMRKEKYYFGDNQLLIKYIKKPSKTDLNDDKKSRPQFFQFAKIYHSMRDKLIRKTKSQNERCLRKDTKSDTTEDAEDMIEDEINFAINRH
jgi:hypothetical protein